MISVVMLSIVGSIVVSELSSDTVFELGRSVIKAKKIQPISTIPQTVENLLTENSTVSLIRRGPNGVEPVIRGESGNNVLITLDGAHVQSACPDHMDPVTSYVEENNMSGISVKSGDDEGMGLGHINMILREAEPGPDQFRWNVNSLGTSINKGVSGSGNIELIRPKIGFTASASGKFVDDYLEPGNITVNNSGLKSENIYTSSTMKLGENSQVRGTFLYDRIWDAGYPALPMDLGYSELIHGAANVKHRLNSGLFIDGQIYMNWTSHAMDDTHRKDIPMHMDMPGKGSTTGAWGVLNLPLCCHNLKVRMESWLTYQSASMTMYEDGQPDMYLETWPETRTFSLNGSFGETYQLNDDWIADGFLTVENRTISNLSEVGRRQTEMIHPGSSCYRNYLSPGISAGIRFKPSEENGLGFHLSFSERFPGMDELYGYYLFNAASNHDYMGNPFLVSEKDLKTELNGKLSAYGLKSNVSLWSSVKDDAIIALDVSAISTMSSGAYGVRQWENSGRELRMGIEANISYQPVDFYTIKSKVSYSRGNSFGIQQIPIVPYTAGETSIILKIPYANISPEVDWAPSQNRLQQSTYSVKHADGYFVLNIRLLGKIALRSTAVIWRFGVENIFNRKWRDIMDWENFESNSPLYRPGRGCYMGITIGDN